LYDFYEDSDNSGDEYTVLKEQIRIVDLTDKQVKSDAEARLNLNKVLSQGAKVKKKKKSSSIK